ncbi:MAG: hypothetical protein Q7J43_07245 [Pseudomonas sp.]|uniref:hypothetical protein n=1 Tax=Pseudomonas sp. TaxID=306 RepID=UPI00271FA40A|nr:hypothetical protein [Pseudomonas sp.]MDO9617464.1 hypothetical protein [Pseudomonas sp.]MDP2443905.1 hypothetical protein [Pseudomonas sp.]MDZ4333297.1 hypothetical protein [Pseudomonas sp.]
MSEPIANLRRVFRFCLCKAEGRFGIDRLSPLLPEILAFWALWHCRHARPPDALSLPR